ncbi:MAG TPA: hypothetical protein VK588_06180 [Chitinophagaceae bacterium]|nr:hypothetical protein [Chitinophagaceae bacterium]
MKRSITCCVVLLFIFGCKKSNEDTDNNKGQDIFPNKIGDKWVYHVVDTTYKLDNVDNVQEYDMNVSVVDSTVLPGGIKANIWVFESPSGRDTNYVFPTADTINFAVLQGTQVTFIRRYIVPLHLHDSWKYTTSSLNDVVVDSVADIVVNGNRFDNAFRVLGNPGFPDAMFNIEEWLADNVGLVKRYYSNFHMSLIIYQHAITWTLVSYHIE